MDPVRPPSQSAQAPVEALVVERWGLLRILKDHLSDLHRQHYDLRGTPGEADLARRIGYWAEVLDWVKQRDGVELILLSAVTPPAHHPPPSLPTTSIQGNP